MKITVCGKGGCGKSTVTALLAKEYARIGKKVLVSICFESGEKGQRTSGCAPCQSI